MEFGLFLLVYFIFFILGVIGLPITSILFKKLNDKGYIFSKAIGFLIVSIPIWFLSSFRIIPFNENSVFVLTLLAFTFSVVFLILKRYQISKLIIYEELIFFVLLMILCLFKATNPRIEGTEKMMNIAIINSIMRTEYFPPIDMWMSGNTINYYYIGHYMYAFLSKLSSIPTNYIYNFGVVWVAVQSIISLFSIGINLINLGIIKNIQTKILTTLFYTVLSIFVILGGNLHYFLKLIRSVFTGENLSYFFPEASRIIPFTINDNPSYAFVLGDLHGHYMSLPFFILNIVIAIYAFKNIKSYSELLIYNLIISPFFLILVGINSWDVITLGVIYGLVNIYLILKFNLAGPQNKWEIRNIDIPLILKYLKSKPRSLKHLNIVIFKCILEYINVLIALVLSGLIIIMPYLVYFKSPTDGIGIKHGGSPIDKLFYMWGIFIIIILLFLVFKIKKRLILNKIDLKIVFLLLFVAMGIIIGVEFVYLKDIFDTSNPTYYRANTVFKFYFHAWIILGIVTSYMLYNLFFKLKKSSKKYHKLQVLFVILTTTFLGIASGSYFIKAVYDNFNVFKPVQDWMVYTLDGIEYIRKDNINKGDYYVINYINKEIKGQPVVLEAVGEAYTYFGRISTYTGLPTIMGWPTHQWQWRKDSVTPFDREKDVRIMYTSESFDEVVSLIKKYQVEYFVIGNKELEKYNQMSKSAIKSIGSEVFRSLGTTLYKVIY